MPPKRAAVCLGTAYTLFQFAAKKKQKRSIDPTEDSESELEGGLDSDQ